LVERVLGKDEVTGSSPVIGSRVLIRSDAPLEHSRGAFPCCVVPGSGPAGDDNSRINLVAERTYGEREI
jgi:hypothetical protein